MGYGHLQPPSWGEELWKHPYQTQLCPGDGNIAEVPTDEAMRLGPKRRSFRCAEAWCNQSSGVTIRMFCGLSVALVFAAVHTPYLLPVATSGYQWLPASHSACFIVTWTMGFEALEDRCLGSFLPCGVTSKTSQKRTGCGWVPCTPGEHIINDQRSK